MGSDRAPNDDPAALADELREAAAKNAAALRDREVPIALEPLTVFRP